MVVTGNRSQTCMGLPFPHGPNPCAKLQQLTPSQNAAAPPHTTMTDTRTMSKMSSQETEYRRSTASPGSPSPNRNPCRMAVTSTSTGSTNTSRMRCSRYLRLVEMNVEMGVGFRGWCTRQVNDKRQTQNEYNTRPHDQDPQQQDLAARPPRPLGSQRQTQAHTGAHAWSVSVEHVLLQCG